MLTQEQKYLSKSIKCPLKHKIRIFMTVTPMKGFIFNRLYEELKNFN